MFWNKLKMLMNFIGNNQIDLIESSLPAIDFELISDKLLSATSSDDIDADLEECLYNVLMITQYVETETDLESILPDDVYDKLYEKYVDLTGKEIVGISGLQTVTDKLTGQHLYPELRGSLDKTHFVYKEEIPENDSRKSLENWVDSIYAVCNETDLSTLKIGHYFKFDGVSGVMEFTGNKLNRVLTRKDTDSNTGTDITHVFVNYTDMEFLHEIPQELLEGNFDYGVQNELLVRYTDIEEYAKIASRPPKNHRSAATSITNTLPEKFNPEWAKYLTVHPVAISSTVKLEEHMDNWLYTGMLNDRYQYVQVYLDDLLTLDTENKEAFLDKAKNVVIKSYSNMFTNRELLDEPIDGIVFTVLNRPVIEKLGRKDNKNKFQVAYKFPAGISKTTVEDVEYSIGPVTGLVTPILKIKPVVIMGNTISNVGLSNIDKFERLNLHKGDEVMVKYNIVPTIYKDNGCKTLDTDKIEFISQCPKCGEELSITDNTESGCKLAACRNPECISRVAGRIYNYVTKLDIRGIGLSTIEDFVDMGILESIPDLYRLNTMEREIIEMPRYGITKYNNIMKAIYDKNELYPHELLGSIGIPNVGRRIMKKLCTEIPFHEVMSEDESVIDKALAIKGIGKNTALLIFEGIQKHRGMIEDIMRYVSIKPYEKEVQPELKVVFSKVRDLEFADFLKEKYHAEIQESYRKDTDVVIIGKSTDTSTKIEKAKSDGKLVITLEEAKEKYNY